MNERSESQQAVADLIHDFAPLIHDDPGRHRLSPCTTLALGNLAMVSGHGGDLSVGLARRRAAERRDVSLERAFEAVMIG